MADQIGSPETSSDEDAISITSTTPSEARDEYPLEGILYETTAEGSGAPLFLVKWEGYPVIRSTWEPQASFTDASTLQEWQAQQTRVADGLEKPFDLDRFTEDVREFQEAQASRKARRKKKRRALGLLVSASEDEADDRELSRQEKKNVKEGKKARRHASRLAKKNKDLKEFINDDAQEDEDVSYPPLWAHTRKLRRVQTSEESSTPDTSEDSLIEDLRTRAERKSLGREQKPKEQQPRKRAKTEEREEPASVREPSGPVHAPPQPGTLPPAHAQTGADPQVARPGGHTRRLSGYAGTANLRPPTTRPSTQSMAMAGRGPSRQTERKPKGVQGADIFKNWDAPVHDKRRKPTPVGVNDPNGSKFTNLSTLRRYEKAGRNEPAPNLESLTLFPAAGSKLARPPISTAHGNQRDQGKQTVDGSRPSSPIKSAMDLSLESVNFHSALRDNNPPQQSSNAPMQASNNTLASVASRPHVRISLADYRKKIAPGNQSPEKHSVQPAEGFAAENPKEQPAEEIASEKFNKMPSEEPAAEKSNVQPAEEPAAEEPAAEELNKKASEEPVAENPKEQPAEDPAAEKLNVHPPEEPAAEKYIEQPAEVLAPENASEQPAEVSALEKPNVQPVEVPAMDTSRDTQRAPKATIVLGPNEVTAGVIELGGLVESQLETIKLAYGDKPLLHFKDCVLADDFRFYFLEGALDLILAGNVDATHDTPAAFDSVVETLRQSLLGAILQDEHFVMIVYPAGLDAWDFVDAGTKVPGTRMCFQIRAKSQEGDSLDPKPEKASTFPASENLLHACEAILDLTYDVILPSPEIDGKKMDNFFVMIPKAFAADRELIRNLLALNGAGSVAFYDTPGAWNRFCDEKESGTILVHPSFTAFDEVPQWSKMMNKYFHVIEVGITDDDEPEEADKFVCRFRFPQGGVVMLTENLMFNAPRKAIELLQCCQEKYRTREWLPALWKIAGRPCLKEWLWHKADERLVEAQGAGLDPTTTNSVTDQAHLWLVVAGLCQGEGGSGDPDDVPESGTLVSNDLPDWDPSPDEPDQVQTEQFVVWALLRTDRFRRFVVVDHDGAESVAAKVGPAEHVEHMTPEEFMARDWTF
ncbi:MAG: hypothetical protein M1832_002902 [Thelocarpon impressellum]|nr:MAG: hypothetical protein M1832_002902 [Thelocarpon impressellum]